MHVTSFLALCPCHLPDPPSFSRNWSCFLQGESGRSPKALHRQKEFTDGGKVTALATLELCIFPWSVIWMYCWGKGIFHFLWKHLTWSLRPWMFITAAKRTWKQNSVMQRQPISETFEFLCPSPAWILKIWIKQCNCKQNQICDITQMQHNFTFQMAINFAHFQFCLKLAVIYSSSLLPRLPAESLSS